jgi:hypothetical protein
MPRFIIDTEAARERAILLLKGADITKRQVFELKRLVVKRSLSQNALYWMWLSCISDETGNDKDNLHDYYRESFMPKKEVLVFSETRMKPKSTTELDTSEFTVYLEKIRIHAAEWNVILPLPVDKNFEEFYAKYQGYIG